MSFARWLCFAGFCATALTSVAQTSSPLPAPPDRAAVKRMLDPWRPPVPPRHLLANIHYVGAVGVSSFLVTTPECHLLLDDQFGMSGKFARLDRGEKENPFVDPAGWRRLVVAAERAYRAQLSLERSLAPH